MASVRDNIVNLDVVYSKLNTTIDKNIELLKEGASAVDAYNKKISVVPSAYKNGLESLSVTLEKVKQSEIELTKAEKEKANAIVKLNQVQRSQNQTEISNLRTKTQTIALKDREQKLLDKEHQLLEKSNSIYNKVQQKVNSLTKTYNDIAIKRELGLKLNTKEEAQLSSLENRLTKYQNALKGVDANIGKHQRNVGNYAGSFNGLSNSINQITRELPAFTFSAQTGFLALSNNIPILTDEIGRLVDKNKELAKQGQPVKSVFSQILGSIFSLQTAMGIGILMFTLYGKEIGAFISNISKAGIGVKTLSEQQTQLNNALKVGNGNASEEVAKLDVLYRKTTDVNLSIEQRKKAVNQLQELYPNYFKNIKDETILNGQAEKSYLDLRDAILAKYMADAIGQQLQENAQERFKDEFKLVKDIAYLKEKIEKDYTKTYINEAGERVKVIDSYYDELSSAEIKLNNIKNARKKDDELLLKIQSEYLQKSKLLNKV